MNTIPTPRRLAHWACACALAAGLVHADVPTPAAAEAAMPFDTYQAWRDTPIADWRALNDRVHAVGGWRAYLREAQDAAAGDDPHTHHHQH
ncbi:MAG: hypothetical protein ACK4R8_04495 [Thiobacillus sp.]